MESCLGDVIMQSGNDLWLHEENDRHTGIIWMPGGLAGRGRLGPWPGGSPLHLTPVTHTCPPAPSVSLSFPLCAPSLIIWRFPGDFALNCTAAGAGAGVRWCTEPSPASDSGVPSDRGSLLSLLLLWGQGDLEVGRARERLGCELVPGAAV